MLIPVLFGVSLIVFFLMRVCAPDPAPIVLGQHATQESMDAWREANGLNDPIVVQYIDFIKAGFTFRSKHRCCLSRKEELHF